MDEEIMKAIEQAAIQAEQSKNTWELNLYIESAVTSICNGVRNDLYLATLRMPSPAQKAHMEMWVKQQGDLFAARVGEVARILLRKELLGEK